MTHSSLFFFYFFNNLFFLYNLATPNKIIGIHIYLNKILCFKSNIYIYDIFWLGTLKSRNFQNIFQARKSIVNLNASGFVSKWNVLLLFCLFCAYFFMSFFVLYSIILYSCINRETSPLSINISSKWIRPYGKKLA